MTIQWNSDCCQCILLFDPPEVFVRSFQRCDIHRGFTGQRLLNEVLAHNRSFPVVKAGARATDAELKIARDERNTEQARILALGPPVRP